jgi:hypothetical protein
MIGTTKFEVYMARPKKLERFVDLFLRVPRESREVIEVEAAKRGIKPVALGREIVTEWASQQRSQDVAS